MQLLLLTGAAGDVDGADAADACDLDYLAADGAAGCGLEQPLALGDGQHPQ